MSKTIRLDKYLASLGITSRRSAKILLNKQNITINGERVYESGIRIQPEKDIVEINNKKIKHPALMYYMLHKPIGIISTTSDEYGRKNVTSLIKTKEKIYPIGRLDKDTSGLILLTNDGELTNKLTHPKFNIAKKYLLKIKDTPAEKQLFLLTNGVLLKDGLTKPAKIKIKKIKKDYTLLEMTISEGRNRQIRRMCEALKIQLLKLHRVQFGPLSLSSLKNGDFRKLTKEEINLLKTVTTEV